MTTDFVTVNGTEFHSTWLRDNCLCPQCRHPENFAKLLNLNSLSGRPRPRTVALDGTRLVIEWDEEDGHVSEYPLAWLAENGPGASSAGELLPRPTLWDAARWQDEQPQVFDMRTADPDGGPWADHLLEHGFAYFEDVTQQDVDRLSTAIGPAQHTEFGRFITVRVNPDVKDLTTTGHALSPHTDFSTYLHVSPLLQFMLFLENEATGGDSVFVDGFKVAEDLRDAHPAHFARLVATPVNFQQIYREFRYFLKRSRPIIETDAQGGVSGLFFAHSHAAAWDVPPAEVEAFYEAYHTLFAMIEDPRYQLRLRMTPGQCMVLQNGRLLHGRTAFDPASGRRALIDAFVPWEYFVARQRFHRRPVSTKSLPAPGCQGGAR